jgi:hypothetical protein
MSESWAPSVAALSIQIEAIEPRISFVVESLNIINEKEIPYKHDTPIENTEGRMDQCVGEFQPLNSKYCRDRYYCKARTQDGCERSAGMKLVS